MLKKKINIKLSLSCRSHSKISQLFARGKIPGSENDVFNKLEITKKNNIVVIIGRNIEICFVKYGKLKKT